MPATAQKPEMTREERIAVGERYGFRYAYGSLFPPVTDSEGRPKGPMPDWMVEAHCCRATAPWPKKLRIQEGQKPRDCEDFAYHFTRFISAIWPKFVWNPNAVKICRELFTEGRQFLGVGGHKSSGKSYALAYFAVAFFLVDPKNTKVIATSKTIQSAQGKIWGLILKAWSEATDTIGKHYMPGIATSKAITHLDGEARNPLRGIELLAGEQSQIKQSAEKLQGIKAPNILVVADELATLSPGLVETAKANLTANKNLKFCGSFNPKTFYDASRMVAMPKKGWGSISIDDTEWETEIGYCIRFDGKFSPNVEAGKEIWEGLYTAAMYDLDVKRYVENTPSYYEQVRGFWSPTGADDAIYSSQEIENYRGEWKAGKGFFWLEPPTRVAGLDPSYAPGGDRAALYLALYGQARFEDGRTQWVFQFEEYTILAEDVTKAEDKSRQVCEAAKKQCEEWGVKIENLGVDITGAMAFGSLMRTVWADGFLPVVFSEKASDTPISDTEFEAAEEGYANKVSELWYTGKPMLRAEQLKGIHPDLAAEMVARSYRTVNGKIQVEPKEKMKLRTGRSPDVADSAFIALEVARQRLGMEAAEKSKSPRGDMTKDEFSEWAEQITGCRAQALEFEYR